MNNGYDYTEKCILTIFPNESIIHNDVRILLKQIQYNIQLRYAAKSIFINVFMSDSIYK